MSTVWNTPAVPADEADYAQAIGRVPAAAVVFAAVLFNFVLCFVDTNLFSISAVVVISTEIVLIGMAFGLIWYRSITIYDIFLVVAAYFFVVMTVRSNFDRENRA